MITIGIEIPASFVVVFVLGNLGNTYGISCRLCATRFALHFRYNVQKMLIFESLVCDVQFSVFVKLQFSDTKTLACDDCNHVHNYTITILNPSHISFARYDL